MTTPITAFTALIDVAEDEQCEEVEEYLTTKGAEIPPSSDADLFPRLQQIIQQCHLVFQDKDLPQPERLKMSMHYRLKEVQKKVEGFFYSVASLFHIIPAEQTQETLELFCSKIAIGTTKENGAFKLKLLGLMFCHLDRRDRLRYTVLCQRVRLAQELGLFSSLRTNVDKLKEWVEEWHLSESQTRTLYQLLWDACSSSNNTNKSLSSQILIELLSTFTASDAHEAAKLAEQLVVLVISDPQQFILDHLLRLEPITALKSERIYQLLTIFISERYLQFVEFYEANQTFVDGLGLDYSYCVHKMRLLTLITLAVESREVAFSDLSSALSLPREEVETFILEAIRLKLVEARMNQVSEKLIVTNSVHRTFHMEQWKLLHERLSSWKQNIDSVKSSLKTVTA